MISRGRTRTEIVQGTRAEIVQGIKTQIVRETSDATARGTGEKIAPRTATETVRALETGNVASAQNRLSRTLPRTNVAIALPLHPADAGTIRAPEAPTSAASVHHPTLRTNARARANHSPTKKLRSAASMTLLYHPPNTAVHLPTAKNPTLSPPASSPKKPTKSKAQRSLSNITNHLKRVNRLHLLNGVCGSSKAPTLSVPLSSSPSRAGYLGAQQRSQILY